MHVLEGVLDMAHDRDISKTVSPAYGTIDDLVTNPEISMLERVLAVGLLVCCLSAARAQEKVPPIVALSIQAHARSFLPGRTISGGDSLEEKALDWAALALHYNTKERSIAWTWANKRIPLHLKNISREAISVSCKRAFCSPRAAILPRPITACIRAGRLAVADDSRRGIRSIFLAYDCCEE
jgi:hypothetical protein